MIRVVYKWKVKTDKIEEFRIAWEGATTSIRQNTSGARGSIMLQSHQNPTEILTIARWDHFEDWKSFWERQSIPEMQKMHSLAERLSVNSYEELEDHTI